MKPAACVLPAICSDHWKRSRRAAARKTSSSRLSAARSRRRHTKKSALDLSGHFPFTSRQRSSERRVRLAKSPKCECAHKLLRGYLRRFRRLRARGDCAVKTIGKEASLLYTCLPAKCKTEHLPRRPRCDQSIADIDRENLLFLSAGRRDQVYTVQSCRRYLQSCNLCSYTGSMLRLSA